MATISSELFGTLGDSPVHKYTLDNGQMAVSVLTYGSILSSILLPDNSGERSEILLGFDDLDGYVNHNTPYFGATIGRVSNRISWGSFQLDDVKYNITKNYGPHTLHGGNIGFDKKLWKAEVKNGQIRMSLTSEDGDQGFPGKLDVEVFYHLTPENQLWECFKARTSKPTPVSLTNHAYFNLAGHLAGSSGLYDHDVTIYSDYFTPVSGEFYLPTGEIRSVRGTPYDLTGSTNLGAAISKTTEGFDTNYCFEGDEIRKMAEVSHEKTGRTLSVFSDQPALQFYTSNFLKNVTGKSGTLYGKHGGFCLESQNYPDSVNNMNFPDPFLRPGQEYSHTVIYQFGVKAAEHPKIS